MHPKNHDWLNNEIENSNPLCNKSLEIKVVLSKMTKQYAITWFEKEYFHCHTDVICKTK